MSLKHETPCDFGNCPYCFGGYVDCEYYCGADEPADSYESWDDISSRIEYDAEEELRGALLNELIYLVDTLDPFCSGDYIGSFMDMTVAELEEQIRQAKDCLETA